MGMDFSGKLTVQEAMGVINVLLTKGCLVSDMCLNVVKIYFLPNSYGRLTHGEGFKLGNIEVFNN